MKRAPNTTLLLLENPEDGTSTIRCVFAQLKSNAKPAFTHRAQHDTFLTPSSIVIAYRYMWEVAGLDQQRLVTSPLTGPFGE